MTGTTTIDIDLRRDLVELYRDDLAEVGYDVRDIDDDAELMRAYFRTGRRLIPSRARRILKSKDFQCSPQHHRALIQIERIIYDGGDLTPYLSKKIKDLNDRDDMLDDWRIHHLHLGTSIESDGFIKRSGPLLHCICNDRHAYFIAILPHGSWSRQDLVRTVHENWPELLERYRLFGVSGDKISNENVKTLRKKRFNYCIEMIDGTVYGLMGGGMSLGGSNSIDTMKADYFFVRVRELELWIIERIEEFAADARRQGTVLPQYPKFDVRVIEGKFYAVEVASSVAIELNTSPWD